MTLYTLYIYMQCASLSINVAILFVASGSSPRPTNRQSALQTAEKENTDRIPFTHTFHPQNHEDKFIILKSFKLL